MLNLIEEQALEALELLVEALTAGKPIKRADYRDLIGTARNAIVKLQKKRSGCTKGLHEGPCECIRRG